MKKLSITAWLLVLLFSTQAWSGDQKPESSSLGASNLESSRIEHQILTEFLFENRSHLNKRQIGQFERRLQALSATLPADSDRLLSVKGPGGGTASVSGTIFDSLGAPIQQITIYLQNTEPYDSPARYFGSMNTDATGTFNFPGLEAGTYYLCALNYSNSPYSGMLWDATGGTISSQCTAEAIHHFDVLDADSLTRDLTLPSGFSISGQLTDAITNAPVDTMEVEVEDITTGYRSRWFTDAAGHYTINGLPNGSYKVYTGQILPDNGNIHIHQIHGGPECNAATCSRQIYDGAGADHVIAGADIAGINFSLNVGARITGRMTDANTGGPVTGSAFIIYVFDDNNRPVSYDYQLGLASDAMATGNYQIGGLLPGDYFVQGDGRDYYVREVYNNVHCPWTGCSRSGFGAQVSLLPQQTRNNIDFIMEHGGKISGQLQDSTGTDLGSGRVQVYDNTGAVAGGGEIGTDYNNPTLYTLAKAVPPGNYVVRSGYVWAGNHNAPYIDERYIGDACPGESCDLTTANTLVNVVADVTTTNIDFTLEMGGSFSGTVTDLSTGTPIPDVFVLVFDDLGRFAASSTTDALGNFTVSGLDTGTFYALTNNGSQLPFPGFYPTPSAGWIDILYDSIPCPGGACDVTTGTPINIVAKGANPIDFVMPEGATIEGKVSYSGSGMAVENCLIEVYDSNYNLKSAQYTDENGNYHTVGLNPGTYYLRTRNAGFLLDVTYGNNYCLNESCGLGQAVQLGSQENITGVDLSLKTEYLFSSDF